MPLKVSTETSIDAVTFDWKSLPMIVDVLCYQYRLRNYLVLSIVLIVPGTSSRYQFWQDCSEARKK